MPAVRRAMFHLVLMVFVLVVVIMSVLGLIAAVAAEFIGDVRAAAVRGVLADRRPHRRPDGAPSPVGATGNAGQATA